MTPLRMCTVCRERKEKKDLIRLVYREETGVSLDPKGILPGRGAYLCRKEACIANAQKRKALERAFSTQVNAEVYQSLAEELHHES